MSSEEPRIDYSEEELRAIDEARDTVVGKKKKLPKDIRLAMRSKTPQSDLSLQRLLGAMFQVSNAHKLERLQEKSSMPELDTESNAFGWLAAQMEVPSEPLPFSIEDLGTPRGVPNTHEGLVHLMEEFSIRKRMNVDIGLGVFDS